MKRHSVAVPTATFASALFAVIAIAVGVVTHDPASTPVTVAAASPDAVDAVPVAAIKPLRSQPATVTVPDDSATDPVTVENVTVPQTEAAAITATTVAATETSEQAAPDRPQPSPARRPEQPTVAQAAAPTPSSTVPAPPTTVAETEQPQNAPTPLATFSHGLSNGSTVDYNGTDADFYGSYTTRGQTGPLHIEAHGNGENGRITVTVLIRTSDRTTIQVERLSVTVTIEGPTGPKTLTFRVNDTAVTGEYLTLTDSFVSDAPGLYSLTGNASYGMLV